MAQRCYSGVMGKSFQKLVEDIKDLRSKNADLSNLRQEMLTRGWDMNSVDRALWQLGIRDRKNVYFVQRLKKLVFIAGVLVGVFGLVFGTIYWENNIKNKDQQVVATNPASGLLSDGQVAGTTEEIGAAPLSEPVQSGAAGIEFSFPSTWELKDESLPDLSDYYSWLIEPATNKRIKAELDKKYALNDSEGGQLTDNVALLNDPLFDQIVTVTVSVFKSPTYSVEESIEVWKDNFDLIDGQLGISASDDQKFKVNGVNGYKYSTNVELGEIKVSTSEYVFITLDSRVEVSIFPAKSPRSVEIDKIINSLTFK